MKNKKGFIVFLLLFPAIGILATEHKPAPVLSRPGPLGALVSPPAVTQTSIAVSSNDPQDSHTVILMLQTRNYLLTIYGGADQLYSVSTPEGVPLAEKLDSTQLEVRFPELHDLVKGSWACDSPVQFDARY